MGIYRNERGQVLALTALCSTILVGFMGLAVDVGTFYRAKRNIQIAADAAAVAAAQDYLYNQSVSSAQTVGQAASASNGYTNNSGGVVVTVNMPPQSGPNQSTGFAEAIVSAPNPTFFLRALGFNSVTVAARAVAGTPTTGSACLWLMATSGTGLKLKGAYDIDAPSCGIYVNSPSSNAISVTGNAGTVNASYIDVVGGSTSNHATSPTSETLHAAPRTTPWGNPGSPTCSYTDSTTTSLVPTAPATTLTVNPGGNYAVYCFSNSNGVTVGNGVIFTGSSSGIVYEFQNGVAISSGATVNFGSCSSGCSYNSVNGTYSGATQGATLDVDSGSFSEASNSILNVYAPTSGTFDGIAIFQPSSNTNTLQVQFGSNNQVLDGYIFAPGAEVTLQDHGGGVTASGIVASDLYDNSSTITIPSYDAANSSTTLNRVVTVVE